MLAILRAPGQEVANILPEDNLFNTIFCELGKHGLNERLGNVAAGIAKGTDVSMLRCSRELGWSFGHNKSTCIRGKPGTFWIEIG